MILFGTDIDIKGTIECATKEDIAEWQKRQFCMVSHPRSGCHWMRRMLGEILAIRTGIEKGVSAVVRELLTSAVEVKGKEDYRRVATISANGDEEIGNMLADILDKVGSQGVVTVEDPVRWKSSSWSPVHQHAGVRADETALS